MNFDKLKAFYLVARHSSLQKGAEELEMESSDVEKLISAFEQEIKTILFNRRQEMWTLTLQGQFLFRKARIILSEIESVRSVLEENDNEELSGTLKIATTNGLGSLWISHYIKSFLEAHPAIQLAIYPQDRDVDVTLGEADIAIRPLIPDAQNVIQHYMMTWHVGLYASPAYIKKFGEPQSLADLDNHRLITLGYENITPYKDVNWMLTIGRRPDEIPREPYLRIQALQAVIDCALEGIGIASLSRELPIIRQGRLVRVLPEIKGPEVDIFFIYPKFMANSKRILAFRDYLVTQIRQEMDSKEKQYVH
ncbi:MAG: LysR substrate-binding domain-containing protein [Alphaproteobacteria bacterium]